MILDRNAINDFMYLNPFHSDRIDTVNLGLPILYFKGEKVENKKKYIMYMYFGL